MKHTLLVLGSVVAGLGLSAPVSAQLVMPHDHGLMVNGVPGGVPDFCENPTVTSARSCASSNPPTWSTNAVPRANAKVLVAAGHSVTYDVVSDTRIQCIDVRGRMACRTDGSTRLKVTNLMVMEGAV